MATNKGKPSGSVAETKYDPGIKSDTRAKSPTPGASGKKHEETEFHPAGSGPPEQNAGGADHTGADAHEDHNP
ncbi:MAG: hypothetical protein JWQ71_2937 [Pedosphaera sp.]|nr:hypothetical protein [Pedosphaera sp.]